VVNPAVFDQQKSRTRRAGVKGESSSQGDIGRLRQGSLFLVKGGARLVSMESKLQSILSLRFRSFR
jgi:hypothetical protein